jgi:hypothetical protein
MNRVTVQYCVNGQYGEFVAKSDALNAQQMVDEMFRTAKPGISFRFFDGNGMIAPTGYTGDTRVYIPSAA